MAFIIKSFFEKFSNTSNISIKVPKTNYVEYNIFYVCVF